MINRETLRNKILTNHDMFDFNNFEMYFHAFVDGIEVRVYHDGQVYMYCDGVRETMDTFKNVYELLVNYKRKKIHATFGDGRID